MKKNYQSILILFFILLSQAKFVYANHIIGAEISYQCSTIPGIYSVTTKIYRDCSNTQFCANCPTGLNPTCNVQLSIIGAGPTSVPGIPSNLCEGIGFGTTTLFVNTATSGFDVVQLCATSKTICSNCGTRTPGTVTPGIEVYTFTGNVNLSAIPSTCCYVNLIYSTCCRSYGIHTIANSGVINFYSFITLNRCETNCNSAPVFTSPVSFTGCSGQEFTYNLGAIDPDGDSLSYSFGSALQGNNTPVPYISPYSGQLPVNFQGFPIPSPPAIPPNGISINSVSGDVRFKPIGAFIATIVIEVKQWKRFTSVPTLLGVTRREAQFYSQVCAPNNPPSLKVYSKDGSAMIEPLYFNHSVCVNNEICFIVVANDNDSGTDTTHLNWNEPTSLTSKGATFTKLYNAATRSSNGPKYDSMLFCWTPTANDLSSMPYSFLATATDQMCPFGGKTMKSFSITIKSVPHINFTKIGKPCNAFQLGYSLTNDATIDPFATKFFVETEPHAKQFITYTSNTPIIHRFTKGGWHKVGVQVSTYAPPMPNGCVKEMWDSVFVMPPVRVSISNAAICGQNPVQVNANGKFGSPLVSSYQYTFYKGAFGSNQIIRAQSSDSNCLIQPPYASDTNSYYVVIRDLLGCTDSASFNVIYRAEPTREMPLSVQYCFGKIDSLDAGTNAGTVTSWQWKKLDGQDNLTDSLWQKLWPNASGKYAVKKVNQYNCTATDTIEVLLLPDQLAMITPTQPSAICEGETVLLTANSAAKQSYKWYKNTSILLPQTTASILAYEEGNYHVVIKDSNSCSKASNIVSVQVNKLPLQFGITGESQPIQDSIYVYEVNRIPGYQYLWETNSSVELIIWGKQDSNVSRISWLPGQLGPGLFNLRLWVKVTNAAGCFIRVDKLITVNPRGPEINSFAPMVAGKNGQVNIYGKYFYAPSISQVRFGGVNAVSFQVISSKQITSVVDTGASGFVEVISPFGSTLKNGFVFLSTGLKTQKEPNTIQMYPNPTQGKLMVNFGGNPIQELKEIRITNALGQPLLSVPIDKPQMLLDLSKFGDLTFCFIEVLNQNAERVFLEKVIFSK
ncbi:MAG: IPT/TIG domain-containing protein [bacterium]|nr:IPT/TIG domain-containing protein [bacterium]